MQKRESCLKEGAGWVERAGGVFCKKGVRVGEGGGCACKDKACEDVIRKNGSF